MIKMNCKRNKSFWNTDCCRNINRLSHVVVIGDPNNIPLLMVALEVLAMGVRDGRRG
jgi:hypothetical protein